MLKFYVVASATLFLTFLPTKHILLKLKDDKHERRKLLQLWLTSGPLCMKFVSSIFSCASSVALGIGNHSVGSWISHMLQIFMFPWVTVITFYWCTELSSDAVISSTFLKAELHGSQRMKPTDLNPWLLLQIDHEADFFFFSTIECSAVNSTCNL